jgi:hypothetical protein
MIFLTTEQLTLNAFGLGYLTWYFSLKGPTFAIVKKPKE